jgi:oligoribonuclease NrnB/cAMP/cGMP phosphodiesterase (DHH superfamily)
MSKLIISHTDLDGVASALIAHKYLLETTSENAEVVLVNYDCAMDVIIEEFSSQKYDEIWIADLSIREAEVFKKIKKFKDQIKTVWIDHHASSVSQDWMDICIIEESDEECAASLMYKYCNSQIDFDIHHYDYLSRYARDVDLWRQKYSRATDLSMIISVLGPQRLFQILNQDVIKLFEFTSEMERALKKAQENLEASLNMATITKEETKLDNNLILVSAVCNGYTSIVGDALGGDRIIVALVDLNNKGISLRTKSANINLPDINFGVHEIAERFEYKGRRGGGHPAAAGAPASDELFKSLSQNLIGVVESIIKDIVNTKFLQKHAEHIEIAREKLLEENEEMQGAEAIDLDKENGYLDIVFEKKFDPVRKLVTVRVNKKTKQAIILLDENNNGGNSNAKK